MNNVRVTAELLNDEGEVLKTLTLEQGGAIVVGFDKDNTNLVRPYIIGNVGLTGFAHSVAHILRAANVRKSSVKMFTTEVKNAIHELAKMDRLKELEASKNPPEEAPEEPDGLEEVKETNEFEEVR